MSGRTSFRFAGGVFVLALTFGATQPTQAGRLIQNTDPGRVTGGKRVRCGDPGGFAHWTVHSVPWFHNTAGQGAGKESPLKKAMGEWSTVDLASHHLAYAGTTTAGFVTDNRNTVGWATGQGCSSSCLALTALVLQQPGQVIIEADITFNATFLWNTNGSDYDTWAVATHELGHSLGLHHSELDAAPKPSMATPYFGPDGRSVAGDDRLMLQCSEEYFTPTPLGVFQQRTDGSIWTYRGQPCAGGSCSGWTQLDDYGQTTSVVADGENLFQLHQDGSIWRFTGKPCFTTCDAGWEKVDNNAQTREIAAGGGHLYQVHYDGSIWRFTGELCNTTGCPGWQMLREAISDSVMSLVADGDQLYMLQYDGSMRRFTGAPCGLAGCGGWMLIDNNFSSIRLAAGGNKLYQLHLDGSIWRFTGKDCNTSSDCPGWQLIDSDPGSAAIAATQSSLFMRRADGTIWRYTDAAWELVDNNPHTESIAARGGQLYQLHDNGRLWRFTGQKCNATGCPGWQLTDEGSGTKSIAVAR